MQLRMLDKKQNELTIEVEGEGHTLCNLLESVLLEDGDVEFANYSITHPLAANLVIRIRTKGDKTPEEALKEAVLKILERGKELRDEFDRVLKGA